MTIERKNITRRSALMTVSSLLLMPAFPSLAQSPKIVVHKDPNCGCCTKWVLHLKQEGFDAAIEETSKLDAVRKSLGVPTALAGCHTAEVDGYVVEGHVPAMAIRELLRERPQATGLAVPGMPAGSPGMEGPRPQRYAAILFGSGWQRPYMQFLGARQID